MNYYEELGIEPSATEEEIGRAHRRLARLMHPDQHVDDDVKKLAETQMRRLNAIVEVLTNPEKRQLYDEQLHVKATAPIGGANPQAVAKTNTTIPALAPPPSFTLGLRRIWRSLPWWVWSTAGALAMTFAISWMVADYSGSSFENRPTDYVRPKDATENKAENQPEPDRLAAAPARPHNPLAALNRILAAMEEAKAKRAAAKPEPNPLPSNVEPKTDNTESNAELAKAAAPAAAEPVEPEPVRISIPSGPEKPDNPNTPAPKASQTQALQTQSPAPKVAAQVANKSASLPVEAKSAPAPVKLAKSSPVNPATPAAHAAAGEAIVSAALPAIPKPEPPNPLAGDWVYAPKEPEKTVKGYFPPEFIELRLVSEQGVLHGQYRARYHVTNAPIPPDVDFKVLAGAADSKKFSWQSSDGSRGVLKITQVDAQNIEVEWKRTTKSRRPELNVGAATLTRRNIE